MIKYLFPTYSYCEQWYYKLLKSHNISKLAESSQGYEECEMLTIIEIIYMLGLRQYNEFTSPK